MKINYKNRDLKIINHHCGNSCVSCELHSHYNIYWCMLLCHSGKVWIKDIFNSDIFKV